MRKFEKITLKNRLSMPLLLWIVSLGLQAGQNFSGYISHQSQVEKPKKELFVHQEESCEDSNAKTARRGPKAVQEYTSASDR